MGWKSSQTHRAQVVGSYKCPSAHISCIYVYFIIEGLQTINGFLTWYLNPSKTYVFTHKSNYTMTTWYLNIYFQSTEFMYSPHNLSDFTLNFPAPALDWASWFTISPSHGYEKDSPEILDTILHAMGSSLNPTSICQNNSWVIDS